MKVFKKIYTFMTGINKQTMLITYREITRAEIKQESYLDENDKTIAKRYLETANHISYDSYILLPNIQDLIYFLTVDCIKYLNKRRIRMLDVGCGSAMHSRIFRKYLSKYGNIDYEGCEVNNAIVKVCEQINPGLKFFVSKADNISARDNKYDLVFSSSVLHYTLDKWKKSLKEMVRVSNQYILITRFPVSKHSKTYYVCQTVRSVYGTEKHYFIVINREEFENIVKSMGLKILARDYSQEMYPVGGVSENAMLCEYLLSK